MCMCVYVFELSLPVCMRTGVRRHCGVHCRTQPLPNLKSHGEALS